MEEIKAVKKPIQVKVADNALSKENRNGIAEYLKVIPLEHLPSVRFLSEKNM